MLVNRFETVILKENLSLKVPEAILCCVLTSISWARFYRLNCFLSLFGGVHSTSFNEINDDLDRLSCKLTNNSFLRSKS